jgi:hypothetical protein
LTRLRGVFAVAGTDRQAKAPTCHKFDMQSTDPADADTRKPTMT